MASNDSVIIEKVDHHHHIYFPRITQKYNQSQMNQYNRKAARETAFGRCVSSEPWEMRPTIILFYGE